MQTTRPFLLPRPRHTLRLGSKEHPRKFWDVKFYPYETPLQRATIFAIIEQNEVFFCRVVPDSDEAIEILHSWRDQGVLPSGEADLINTCSWCFIDQSEPLLAVSGDSGQIKLLNAVTGSLFNTLVGHGLGTVNDLATHPIYPWIIASASMDTSVRIWDLRKLSNDHEFPCVIICGHSQGHREGLLTVGWHSRGRYLVTGGHDHRICVWTIPDLAPTSSFWVEISKENQKRSSDEVRVIQYPHFTSSAVHSDYVDKIVFHGDLVLSKAAQEHKLVLWKITGFNSHQECPPTEFAPKTAEHLETRNGFMRTKITEKGITRVDLDERFEASPPYERLLEFAAPESGSFYMRFGLLQPSIAHPDLHPVLAFGNTQSSIFFWDLARLEYGHDGGLEDYAGSAPSFRKPAKKKGIAMRTQAAKKLAVPQSASPEPVSTPSSRGRSASLMTISTNLAREESTGATSDTTELSVLMEPPVPNRSKYPIIDPYLQHVSHKRSTLAEYPKKTQPLTSRAADWSPCGRWCVVVGESISHGGETSYGVAVLFERWT